MPYRSIRTVVANRCAVAARSTTTVRDAARVMKRKRAGVILVCDNERLLGVFTERDALCRVTAEGRDPSTTVLGEVMTANPQTISPDRPLGHALHMMYEGGFRNVPVVEDGQPIGVVSARDSLGPELREFAAEIDEREHIAEILA